MKFPDSCPTCKASFRPYPEAVLLVRGELDWNSDEPNRIEDTIYECSRCHQLFRARWSLESFVMLKEEKEK